MSTADQRRSSPKTMISCNKKSLYLPPEMPAIHVEFTEYYFPDGKDYPSRGKKTQGNFLNLRLWDVDHFPSSFLSHSTVSEPVRAAERSAAGVGSPQPSLAQPLCSGPEAESGAVHGDIQAQWLTEAGRARRHKSRRPHAEGRKESILLQYFCPIQMTDFCPQEAKRGKRDFVVPCNVSFVLLGLNLLLLVTQGKSVA